LENIKTMLRHFERLFELFFTCSRFLVLINLGKMAKIFKLLNVGKDFHFRKLVLYFLRSSA